MDILNVGNISVQVLKKNHTKFKLKHFDKMFQLHTQFLRFISSDTIFFNVFFQKYMSLFFKFIFDTIRYMHRSSDIFRISHISFRNSCNLQLVGSRKSRNAKQRFRTRYVKVVADHGIARDENSGPDSFGRTVASMNHAESLANGVQEDREWGYCIQVQWSLSRELKSLKSNPLRIRELCANRAHRTRTLMKRCSAV